MIEKHQIKYSDPDDKNYRTTPEYMLEGELQSAKINPWNDVNFLKKAFLEGCDNAGIFDGI